MCRRTSPTGWSATIARTKGCGLSGLGRPGRGKSTVCYSPRHRSRRPQEPRDWSGVNTTRVMQVASRKAPGSALAASGHRACE